MGQGRATTTTTQMQPVPDGISHSGFMLRLLARTEQRKAQALHHQFNMKHSQSRQGIAVCWSGFTLPDSKLLKDYSAVRNLIDSAEGMMLALCESPVAAQGTVVQGTNQRALLNSEKNSYKKAISAPCCNSQASAFLYSSLERIRNESVHASLVAFTCLLHEPQW